MSRAIAALAVVALATGCLADTGPCDEAVARTVVYTDDSRGLPAYAGQAMLISSCGGGSFCHAPDIDPAFRYGAPHGLDFDLELASTADEVERLRRSQQIVYDYRRFILDTIEGGRMPPGEVGAALASQGAVYRGVPALGSREGQRVVSNWLACGAPVVERLADDRPNGVVPVGAIVAASPSSGCLDTERLCSGFCIDVVNDPANCGECNAACATGQGCSSGVCGGCSAGLVECASGCTNTDSDGQNCGSCGHACDPSLACFGGACVSGCPAGTSNCSSSCVDLQTDVFHCGACAVTCAAGDTCEAGQCSCGDTTSDPLNCGACGNVCPAGSSCTTSQCLCSGALTICGGACADLASDEAHCGGCNQACAANETCNSGSCEACGVGISYAANIAPIFDNANRTCTNSLCHDSTNPASGLNLTLGSSYANLVNVAADCGGRVRVVPGSPTTSYLLNKLIGTNLCKGKQMPLNGSPLSASQIDLISQWICAGAPNN